MAYGLARRELRPRVPLRHGEGDKYHLTSVEGLAALSLDALSSVAYGPEAIVLVLIAAGTGALSATLPVTLVIAGLLAVLVVSYGQVIAVHPDGGGAYAVGKKDLGPTVSLLAAASLVVDYVLTVTVSLAAGAASLASAFPVLGSHLLAVCLIGLALLTAVNLRGVAESARVLMLPTVLFIVSILGIVVLGLGRGHPVAFVGTVQPVHATEALSVLLLLKAFSSGCSALTGVEAIANGVPSFREPRVKRAQHTELMLGALLGLMLIGMALLIRRDHVAPRGGVTVLAQLTAGAYGTGWPYYATNLIVTLALAFAANTSFGGLPVLMSLLAKDHRLPHLFGLRTERPVYRWGVVTLALLAAALLIAVNADTHRMIPLFAIGVFIGFTISQTGLVRHWAGQRPHGWLRRAVLNGVGAVLTAVAGVVLLTTKFLEGAWVVVVAIPLLMLLFDRIQRYYTTVGLELGLGEVPPPLRVGDSLVIVPVGEVSRLTQHALSAARALGHEVVAVAVHADPAKVRALRESWDRWNPGVRLDVVDSPQRSLVEPIVAYVRRAEEGGRQIAVLIPEVEPLHRRYQILQNQRGLLLAAALRARTDVVVCVVPYRLSL
ncbi:MULTISPECIES: APC family permease [Streptomyces]|uniref:APC family permease n=1 Tax=Streptomyces mirabilis TaxID=68239 RepID=A0ABU3UNC7_9ACTN|nr:MULTISPECIES: APC family permease [Streptomyces]MCX4610900.1 APC family permease [Streptomyces mirabilis]MCX5351115.1 APC family permease [Streptomyces mirabilis]MDU8995406.1 APC family permease [Streptomyces mirabilis]NMI60102.1 APC family permease [Streptomyces sp. RLA2-12]QDN59304.1 APC family permease [Streptomyces sp. S1D4-20]